MSQNYNPSHIEKKWQELWERSESFKTFDDPKKEKFYILEMFLYPSGNIHMGHVRNYAIGDTLSLFRRSQGYNVLHPMGWDAFGLPAENAAIQNNLHPNDWTIKNIESMKVQLKALGFSYDWSREINTSQKEYYKHEQEMFIKFIEKNLAYQKESIVNWDPVDCTVLANEQVIDGKGWRSGAKIEKKKLKQWFLKITKYANELLEELDNLPNWPDNVKIMQKNWIGKSKGALIDFKVDGYEETISVFSTRAETIFGATFLCIACDHEFVSVIDDSVEKEIFIKKCKESQENEEIDKENEKEGWFTGKYVIHPFIKGKKLPVYIANYVISGYGTGAVFGCPAHDLRDFEFAEKYDIEKIQVLEPTQKELNILPYLELEGKVINSEFLDGLDIKSANDKIIKEFIKEKSGNTHEIFKLKDWGISRQRYWGCPIPVIYCKSCGVLPVRKEDLPIELPQDVSFEKTGNPLDHHPTWKHTKCHICNGEATRETDTFDTFFESSWYFARFCTPHEDKVFDKDVVEKWMPVDQYIGGIEHAILHLLYARFFTKALRGCEYLNVNEPFKGLLTQGMICHKTFKDSDNSWLSPDQVIKAGEKWVTKDGKKPVQVGRTEKMSKSKKNTIDPTYMIDKYGADAVRLFLLSDSPPTRDLEWSDDGIEGCFKYLNSIYVMCTDLICKNASGDEVGASKNDIEMNKSINQSIKNVTENLNTFTINKAIADIRKFSNDIGSIACSYSIKLKAVKTLLKLLSVFAPHISHELWEKLGDTKLLIDVAWPNVEEKFLVQEEVKLAIQINGKTRKIIDIPIDYDKEVVLSHISDNKILDKYLFDANIKRVIYVPNKIINFVIQ